MMMMMLVGDNDINGRVFIELNCIRARATQGRIFATTRILLCRIYYIMYGAATYNSPYHIILYLHILFTSIIIILYITFVEMYQAIIFPIYIYVTMCRLYAAEVVCSAQSRRQRSVDT